MADALGVGSGHQPRDAVDADLIGLIVDQLGVPAGAAVDIHGSGGRLRRPVAPQRPRCPWRRHPQMVGSSDPAGEVRASSSEDVSNWWGLDMAVVTDTTWRC